MSRRREDVPLGEFVVANIVEAKVYGVPVGKLLSQVRLSESSLPTMGLMNEALGEGGLIILITHHNRWDDLMIPVGILEGLEFSEAVVPRAGYLETVPMLRQVMYQVNRGVTDRVRMRPVVRRKERERGLFVGREAELNGAYINDMLESLRRRGVVGFIAGAAERTPENYLDRGVFGVLIKSGVPIVVAGVRHEPVPMAESLAAVSGLGLREGLATGAEVVQRLAQIPGLGSVGQGGLELVGWGLEKLSGVNEAKVEVNELMQMIRRGVVGFVRHQVYLGERLLGFGDYFGPAVPNGADDPHGFVRMRAAQLAFAGDLVRGMYEVDGGEVDPAILDDISRLVRKNSGPKGG